MTPKEIFSKTLVFGWIKLGLGVLNIIIDIALFALLMGLSVLFKSEGATALMFLLWLAGAGIVNFLLNHYIGYLVKAGHVAVIAIAFKNGVVPYGPVSVGKEMVKERFGTSNVYFMIDKLVAGSVKQIQRMVGRVTDTLLGAVPGSDTLKSISNKFIDISLGYVDECCLGYTFYYDKQNPYKSAADGVVVYAQNWKTLLKDAAKTTAVVIFAYIVVTLVAFLLVGGLFRMLEWNMFVAFVISLLFAYSVKYAFIDSWILVKMMSSYMSVVPSTRITFDLYGKLSGMSAKFKKLLDKGGDTTPPVHNEPTAQAEPVIRATAQEHTAQTVMAETSAPPSRFCSSCGTRLEDGAEFCGNCGTRNR
ncbi:MAG: zinc ribbon domain-containing protein [Bacteroidales bacterium]|nr:zinc ribbon domain-containing protein [Bacteroidales bacterium]